MAETLAGTTRWQISSQNITQFPVLQISTFRGCWIIRQERTSSLL